METDDIEVALRVFGGSSNIDVEAASKSSIGRRFFDDATSLHQRVNIVWTHPEMSQKRFRSKVFVDILMALECSLKAAIIFSAQLAIESAFAKARKGSHRLKQLLKTASEQSTAFSSLTQAEVQMINIADDLGVRMRYSMDFFELWFAETPLEKFTEQGALSGSIMSNEWIGSFKALLSKIIDLTHGLDKEPMAFTGTQLGEIADRIDKFFASLTKKRLPS